MRSRAILDELELPSTDPGEPATSALRFSDGGQYRIEIPSVEGPEAMQHVLDEAQQRGVMVHRVSQGGGIYLLTDDEICEMVDLGSSYGVETCLFVGPRASHDVGRQAASSSGSIIGGSLRGARQLVHGLEDVLHGVDLGVRSVLVSDLGQLSVLGAMRAKGHLPEDFIIKVSISLPVANPATARVLEDLGATTLNLPTDLSLGEIAAIRAAVALPLDCYIEGADDFGAPVRYYDVPELVRIAAPVHLKFTVRNAPSTYPSGGHLQDLVNRLARERVRRASIGLNMLTRYYPEATASPIAAQQ